MLHFQDPLLVPFDHAGGPRVVYGPGSIARLGELVRELGGRRVLLVTDPGVRAAGHAEAARGSLCRAGLEVALFDEVEENPTTRNVRLGLEAARCHEPECIVAVGGGSAMDCAKGIDFLYTCGGEIRDYWGWKKATRPLLPLVAVPTTAGTGSEMQSYALISDERTHQKMACGDPGACPKVALLDPELTLSQPARVTAASGIDALTHAVESYVTRKRNVPSILLARRAWELLSSRFPRVLERPGDLEARAAVQLGAAFAGAAIERSMLGAAHAAANPLTAHFGIPHGAAVGLMLPHVVRFNAPEAAGWYVELLRASPGWETACPAESLACLLTRLYAKAGFSPRLKDWEVDAAAIPDLAAEAAAQWTATFNPRRIGRDDFVALYEAAL